MDNKFSVLVVDDSLISREWAIEMMPPVLRKHIEVFEADNGHDAVLLYKEHNPFLMLLDITMPDMDGFEVLKQVKEYNPEALVLIITADRQKITRKKMLDMGAFDVLHKPLDEEEFREALYKIMQLDEV